jgi:hypothetical protein
MIALVSPFHQQLFHDPDFGMQVFLTTLADLQVSTFPVQLLPGSLDVSASTLQGSSRATAGSNATFILQLRDAFGNQEADSGGIEPEITILPPPDSSGVIVPLLSKDFSGGKLRVVVSPTVAGRYAVYAKMGGVQSRDSPFFIAIEPSSKNARASSVNMNKTVIAGVPSQIIIAGADRYPIKPEPESLIV